MSDLNLPCKDGAVASKYPELDSLTDQDTGKHREIVTDLTARVQKTLDEDPNGWSNLRTQKAATQKSEGKTKQIIRDVLNSMDLSYKEASSNKPYDFRDVGKNQGIPSLWMEIKKTDSYTACLNDTLPHPRAWYIFFATKYEKVRCISGNEMLKLGMRNETDTFGCGDIYEYFKQIQNIRDQAKRCGAFKMCTRANLFFDISSIMKSKITLKVKPKVKAEEELKDLRLQTPVLVSANLEEPNGMYSS